MNSKFRMMGQSLMATAAVLTVALTQGGAAWAGADPFVGEISLVGFNFAPIGWAECNGQTMSIAQNTALFSLLGTMYGGNGTQTFALPDLRGRVAIHNSSTYIQGQTGGSATATLTVANLPAHTHTASTVVTISGLANASPAIGSEAAAEAPAGNSDGDHAIHSLQYGTTAPAVTMTADRPSPTAKATTTIGSTGGGQSFSIMQPYLVLNYIISLQGIFPARE